MHYNHPAHAQAHPFSHSQAPPFLPSFPPSVSPSHPHPLYQQAQIENSYEQEENKTVVEVGRVLTESTCHLRHVDLLSSPLPTPPHYTEYASVAREYTGEQGKIIDAIKAKQGNVIAFPVHPAGKPSSVRLIYYHGIGVDSPKSLLTGLMLEDGKIIYLAFYQENIQEESIHLIAATARCIIAWRINLPSLSSTLLRRWFLCSSDADIDQLVIQEGYMFVVGKGNNSQQSSEVKNVRIVPLVSFLSPLPPPPLTPLFLSSDIIVTNKYIFTCLCPLCLSLSYSCSHTI